MRTRDFVLRIIRASVRARMRAGHRESFVQFRARVRAQRGGGPMTGQLAVMQGTTRSRSLWAHRITRCSQLCVFRGSLALFLSRRSPSPRQSKLTVNMRLPSSRSCGLSCVPTYICRLAIIKFTVSHAFYSPSTEPRTAQSPDVRLAI